MAGKESTLTTLQRSSIDIKNFIFHIIIVENDKPEYLEEVDLEESQKFFFRNRIAEAAKGTQFSFLEKDTNTLLKYCKKIIDSDDDFVQNSKYICVDFRKMHKKNMTDGAFIVAKIEILSDKDEMIPLIALLKMDQRKVLEYTLESTAEGKKAKIREIADSFIESKEALQKIAIIDISDEFKWDILARERGKSEGIADYFSKFLVAEMIDTPIKLTEKTVEEIGMWARLNAKKIKDIDELRDITTDYPSYLKNKAIKYMKTNSSVTFDSDNFVDSLFGYNNLSKDSIDKVEELKTNIKSHLEKKGIWGQVFLPRADTLKTKYIKNKRKTEEGVSIEWEGNAEDKNIKFEHNGDITKIIIETRNLQDMDNDK